MGTLTSPAAKFISISAVLSSIATGAVVLRLVALRIRKGTWQAHDTLCVLSLVSLFGFAVTYIVGGIHGGVGLHIAQISLAEVTVALKVLFAGQFFFCTGTTTFRLAILCLYIQIFRRRSFLRAAYATAVVVGLFFLQCILVTCLTCRPIDYTWNKAIKGNCVHTRVVELFSAAFNMVLDVWVVCLPLPIIWHLQMLKKRKMGISAAFALSLVNAAINLGRLVHSITCDEEDITYCMQSSILFILGELCAGILVACVPTLGPVFFRDRFAPKAEAHLPYSNRPLHKSPYTTLGEDDIALEPASQ